MSALQDFIASLDETTPRQTRDLAISVLAEVHRLERMIFETDEAIGRVNSIKPLKQVQKEHVRRALRLCGSVKVAARKLGIGESTLYRYIDRQELDEYE